MMMKVALGNLGDPDWFLSQEIGVKSTAKKGDKIGFDQAGKQQVRDGTLHREV